MRLEVGEHRDPGFFREGAQLRGASGLPCAHACHDHRALRLPQQMQRSRDSLGRRSGRRLDLDRFGNLHRACIDGCAQNIGRHVQQHRPRRPRSRNSNGMRDQSRDLLYRRDLVRPLGHGPADGHLIDSRLEGVGLGVAQCRRTAYVQDRRAVQVGVCHGRNDVGEARSGRDHRNTQLARGA